MGIPGCKLYDFSNTMKLILIGLTRSDGVCMMSMMLTMLLQPAGPYNVWSFGCMIQSDVHAPWMTWSVRILMRPALKLWLRHPWQACGPRLSWRNRALSIIRERYFTSFPAISGLIRLYSPALVPVDGVHTFIITAQV